MVERRTWSSFLFCTFFCGVWEKDGIERHVCVLCIGVKEAVFYLWLGGVLWEWRRWGRCAAWLFHCEVDSYPKVFQVDMRSVRWSQPLMYHFHTKKTRTWYIQWGKVLEGKERKCNMYVLVCRMVWKSIIIFSFLISDIYIYIEMTQRVTYAYAWHIGHAHIHKCTTLVEKYILR